MDSVDALIARYVAGALPRPASALVQAHLALKPDNHALLAGLEALAGDAIERADPVPLARAGERLHDAIVAQPMSGEIRAEADDGLFPPVLRDMIGHDVDDMPWRTKMPGFREFDVGEIDGCHVSVFWIRPGRKVPAHTHEGAELSLVLDGAFSDSRGRYGRGDLSVADDTVDHRPIAEMDRPCIGVAVTDGKLRLTGPLHQRLSDILAG